MSLSAFDPPYVSELEQIFAWSALKYFDEKNAFAKQREIVTCCGNFILDFFVATPSKKIGFECDGKEFHDFRRDEFRDAAILETGEVDIIFRLPGSALFYHTDDVFYLLSVWHAELFTTRGLTGLKTLSSDAARLAAKAIDDTGTRIYYRDTEAGIGHVERIWRRSLKYFDFPRNISKHYSNYLLNCGMRNLDEAIEGYDKKIFNGW